MKIKNTVLGATLALGVSGGAQATTISLEDKDKLLGVSESTFVIDDVPHDTALSIDNILSGGNTPSEFGDLGDILDAGRTQAGQKIIDSYEARLNNPNISIDEKNSIIDDFTREYEAFLSKMTSPGEIGSPESIHHARVSATGMFTKSLASLRPGLKKIIGDTSIEGPMSQGVSGYLGDILTRYEGEDVEDYVVCNVVGRQNVSVGVDGGNCGSGLLLQNMSVSSVYRIEGTDIIVGQIQACNGNFFIAFKPENIGNSNEVAETLERYKVEKRKNIIPPNTLPNTPNTSISYPGVFPIPPTIIDRHTPDTPYNPPYTPDITPPAVVPLPPSGLMMLSGLGLFFLSIKKLQRKIKKGL